MLGEPLPNFPLNVGYLFKHAFIFTSRSRTLSASCWLPKVYDLPLSFLPCLPPTLPPSLLLHR